MLIWFFFSYRFYRHLRNCHVMKKKKKEVEITRKHVIFFFCLSKTVNSCTRVTSENGFVHTTTTIKRCENNNKSRIARLIVKYYFAKSIKYVIWKYTPFRKQHHVVNRFELLREIKKTFNVYDIKLSFKIIINTPNTRVVVC